ncbi:MAG TPA: carboxylesterase [Woeseiaceae bacterium]|nr:carboxylesterase [Woeseiaceae bacterium]
MSLPETVEINPPGTADGSVIWLHGLGADGHDFEPLVPELKLGNRPALRFVFPHAPVREVTINNGIAMRAWYDILTLERTGPQDEHGIRESALLLEALIERERQRGIPYHRIVVAGFSQGGAIALHTALRFPHRLCGLLALSTWLPLAHTLEHEVVNNESAQGVDLPVMLAHGSFDPMLPLALGMACRRTLEELGFTVEWHEYPMAHAVCAEEITDIRAWLLRVCGAAGDR